MVDGDDVVVLLERAAAVAATDPGVAGSLAVWAAESLEGAERYSTLLAAAQLFTAAADWNRLADTWAAAAEVAPDESTKVGHLSSQGNAERQAGRWNEAEASHRQALSLVIDGSGVDAMQLAVVRHNLAMTLKYTGGFAEAERLYLQALDTATALGDHEFAAVIYHNLGGLAHARGTSEQGVRWARQGLRLRKSSSSDPVAAAEDQGALAALLIDTGDFDEAEQLLLESRAIFVGHLYAEHYEVAVVDGNLAAIALARGDLVGAETRARLALSGKENALGNRHPELAPTLTTLGTIRRRCGDPDEAVELHRRALDLLAPHVVDGHPLLRTVRGNLEIATVTAKSRPT
ncbi:tetratricopeptide repeat protein [Kribbella sp. NBC_01505]|uniref:tetratricopeptide repeat protein n=1 Tax=Kribbella sp. NBC_01505 TaxID=2903580 RepID=UPI00386AD852